MNSRIVTLVKIFNKKLLLGSSCLLLQGCATWFQSTSEKGTTTPASTVINKQEDNAQEDTLKIPADVKLLQDDSVETTKIGEQQLRALPRRPEKIDEIEVDVEEAVPDIEVTKETIMYTVQRGDTLSLIAKKFHVNVNQLVNENHLINKNKLFIGQVLAIPSVGVDVNENYIVQKGDSLSSIANKFNTTIEKIRANNHLKSDVIFVGQKLSLSGEKSSTSITKLSVVPIDTEKYVVQAGDILWNIARRCGMSVKQLMEINNISNPKNLRVGQVLYVKAQPTKEGFEPEETHSITNKAKEDTQVITSSNLLDNLNTGTEEPVQEEKPSESKNLEEDNFEDLFEENNDIPVIPLEEIK